MMWVVIGHAGPTGDLSEYPPYALFIYNFAYSFHMRLFVTISGFLFFLTRLDRDEWNYVTTIKDKLVRFGIPFMVFTLFGIVLKSLFSGSVERSTSVSIGELVNAVLYPYNGPMREFWFIATIMWYFALFPFWKFVIRSKLLSICTLGGLALLSIWHPNIDLFAINHVCIYAFFFFSGILCGILYKKDPDFIMKKGFPGIIFLIGFLIYVLGRCFSAPLLAPIGGIMFSLSISLWLNRVAPSSFSSFRDYTYQIFLMGIFVQVLISIIRQKLSLPFTPVYFFSMIAGLYIPVLVSKTLERVNWNPLLLCVGLKKKDTK